MDSEPTASAKDVRLQWMTLLGIDQEAIAACLSVDDSALSLEEERYNLRLVQGMLEHDG